MRRTWPLLAAGLFAAAGAFLAARAVVGQLTAPPPAPAEAAPASIDVALKSIRIDSRPNEENVGPLIDEAVAAVGDLAEFEGARLGIPPSRVPDLAAAFGERFAATIDPDFERDLANRIARGADPVPPDLIDEYRAFWERGYTPLRFAEFSLADIEIRTIYADGVRLADPLDGGFQVSTFSKLGDTRDPLTDTIGDRLDVVEIRVPMRLLGNSTPYFVGFQFEWSPQRGQWLPLANTVYYWTHLSPGDLHLAIPMY